MYFQRQVDIHKVFRLKKQPHTYPRLSDEKVWFSSENFVLTIIKDIKSPKP